MITSQPRITLYRLIANRAAAAGFQVAAALTLIAILGALILHWPVPLTGLSIDIQTGIVVGVEPGSMADHGGILVGDQIVRIYDYDLATVDRHWWLFPLDWRTSHPVPIQLVRSETILQRTLIAQAPTWDVHAERLTWCVLALSFWLTGYLFGVLRSPEVSRAPAIAWYWITLASITGVHNIIYYGSYPISILLWYMLITVYAPLSIAMNVWFVQRSTAPERVHQVTRWSVRSVIGMQCVSIVVLGIWQPTIAELHDRLSLVVLPAVSCAFLITSVLLWRAYQQTTILHIKRQIRLLGLATGIIAGVWLGLRVLPLSFGIELLIAGHWMVVLSCLIPCAYLIGNFVPDLYRIDDVLSWLFRQLSITLIILLLLGGVASIVDVRSPVGLLWIAVVFVLAYRAIAWLLTTVAVFGKNHPSGYQPLIGATRRMMATLESTQIVSELAQGIQQTFGVPPVACYAQDPRDPTMLVLLHSDRLRLPLTLSNMACTAIFQPEQALFDPDTLRQRLAMSAHDPTIDVLVTTPGIAFWAPLWQTRTQLLGVVVLGFRDDLDPYRAADLQELQRCFDAATLAFANSAAFVERQRDTTTIRELYQRLKHIQDETAAGIAREIHDEVMNVGVRINLMTLRRILTPDLEPRLAHAVQEVIDGEQAISATLRNICERLYPTGIDDPLGFPSVLQRQVNRAQASWDGSCQLVIVGTPMPIAPVVQREALRIAREAMANAVKHSHGTRIVVTLTYPEQAHELLCLEIRDNGTTHATAHPRAGNFGMYNMIESAHMINGQLSITPADDGGTIVTLFVARALEPLERMEEIYAR